MQLAGRDVGTFPEDDLAATVADIAEQYAKAPVKVRTDDRTYETTAAKLGGDIHVLVAGKGHEVGQYVAGVVHEFDDRVELRRAIEERFA